MTDYVDDRLELLTKHCAFLTDSLFGLLVFHPQRLWCTRTGVFPLEYVTYGTPGSILTVSRHP